ncbi:beta-lactamase (cephalosporinase) [Oceanobacillus iheyensis HTE831]|uniref:Beta-lactamase (Cephalosporinase) n=1 Tax=Oceanobacillus iheyensis (strain DSM 14371 / CIP 107618 / JCM 11309 / KCTC 3954 / HTE831) TaxID=221109 RepID=Q8CXL1_OCEIH|nr:serine hydrolase [Oceanobacillus iheyensis]BAC12623.1 beta-lactamase (cephalosporinase) [Oceanobacillus iheyensis HTE831]
MRKKVMSLLFTFILLFSTFISGATGIYASESGLNPGDAHDVEMLQQPLDDLDPFIENAISDQVMPGAVVLVARDGQIVKHDAYGYAARYTDGNFTEMENPIEMQENTIFDTASISKLFTATAIMTLWDEGLFELDDPVALYIPEFASNGKEEVTIKQLLTHTSGFRASTTVPVHEIEGDREDRLDFVLNETLEVPPGTRYLYSDVDFITLGVLIERLSGQRQDEYVAENITEPLQMSDTMYSPPASLKNRIAATEYQANVNRGLVWGSVHDEKAWALDGVAGHAGVFSSAEDLAVFGQMMLNEGSYQGEQILSEEAFDLITTNWNGAFPGQDQGLGWELNQSWYMDDLAEQNTIGHTGYTGTSIVISPNKKSITILLTNRVHPTRNTVSTNPTRRMVSEKTASAIDAWSAESMASLVNRLVDRGEITDVSTTRSLLTHLRTVSHFESLDQAHKVRKHLEGLQLLVDFHNENNSISDNAYETLTTDIDYLTGKWQ